MGLYRIAFRNPPQLSEDVGMKGVIGRERSLFAWADGATFVKSNATQVKIKDAYILEEHESQRV